MHQRRPRNSKNPLAFTLIEIMVTITLLGILVLTVGSNFRKSTLSTKGAALALAAALTEARQQAIVQQLPVALVIPSGNGAQGQADSYYIASGEQPRITQVRSLGSEQPDLRLMVGHWPLDTSKLRDSTLTTTVTPPPETVWENDFDVNQWGLPAAKDYAFIFTPRGKLISNGLPHFDGAYHIIVSHGGTSTTAALSDTSGIIDPPTLYSPTQVGSPYTVSISPAGTVSVTRGVVGAPDSVTYVKDQALVFPAPNPPSLALPASSAPVVTSVTLLPDPATLALPSGVDTLLAPGRHMTITARAQSPDGVPLFCQWKATGGGLSSPQEVRMTYLPQSQEWESVWQWRFPTDAKAGDRFTIEGVVKDKQGNESPLGLGVGEDPFVVQAGDPTTRVAFETDRTGVRNIFQINSDLTGLTQVSTFTSGIAVDPVISPDGQRILFRYYPPSGNSDICVMNADGTGYQNLTNHPSTDQYASWSPDGTQIAFSSTRVSGWRTYLMNADGTGLRRAFLPLEFQGNVLIPVWSPDSTRIAYRATAPINKTEIFVTRVDGSGTIRLTSTFDTVGSSLTWSPDGTQLCFWARSVPMGDLDLYVVNADGMGPPPIQLTNVAGTDSDPMWSPTAPRILFSSYRLGPPDVFVMNSDGTGQANLTNSAGHESSPVWSGNGKYIAFRDGSSPNEISLIKADGSNLINLSNDSGYNGSFHIR